MNLFTVAFALVFFPGALLFMFAFTPTDPANKRPRGTLARDTGAVYTHR